MAAIPSPRPTQPIPSLLFPFTDTAPTSTDARRLAHHRHVHVARSQPRLPEETHHALQEDHGVRVPPRLVLRREMGADVAETGRAQERVRHRVRHGVRVGMAGQPLRVRDHHPPQHEAPPFGEPVRVVAYAYPHLSPLNAKTGNDGRRSRFTA